MVFWRADFKAMNSLFALLCCLLVLLLPLPVKTPLAELKWHQHAVVVVWSAALIAMVLDLVLWAAGVARTTITTVTSEVAIGWCVVWATMLTCTHLFPNYRGVFNA